MRIFERDVALVLQRTLHWRDINRDDEQKTAKGRRKEQEQERKKGWKTRQESFVRINKARKVLTSGKWTREGGRTSKG